MRRTYLVVAAAGVLALAACGSDGGNTNAGSGPGGIKPPKIDKLASLGSGEGQVNLVAWAGYAENGSSDPKVNWGTPLAQKTRCKVNTKIAGTSDEMVTLM